MDSMDRSSIALFASLALLLLLASCSGSAPVCTLPYIAHGNTCCLDANNDSVCDPVQDAGAAADCSLCPPKFVTQKEEVTVYRYVCENGSVMGSADDCGKRVVSDASLFTPNNEQDAAYIKEFTANPACRGSYRAAEIHLSLAQNALNITFFVQDDPSGAPRPLKNVSNANDQYFYIGFCDSGCDKITDATLPADKAYLVSAVLQYADRKVTTKDLLIDPTPSGDFGTKRCS